MILTNLKNIADCSNDMKDLTFKTKTLKRKKAPMKHKKCDILRLKCFPLLPSFLMIKM